jgi:superfamily I DNA and/or RNA helicase
MFDLIIFDEASQSPVADSLTSLYRGKKVVVIGDEKQLRPSDLFELKEDEYGVDEDIDRTLLSESLLTLANRAFSYNYLKWHYRSAYQELIDFSNHAFYEGRLKIAPNILKGATPIRWIYCDDGVWLDRKNIREAIHVVDELKKIFSMNKNNGTNRSVGIITFNYQQRVEIENEIDRRRQKDPEFDKLYSEIDNPETRNLDALPFVKNIENAQGDERDIIIFSLGYAPENPEVRWIVFTLAQLPKK